MVQSTLPLPIFAVNSNATNVDKSFYQSLAVPLISGSGGLNITFRIYDDAGNQVDNMLVDRFQPMLGMLSYNLTSLDIGVIARAGVLPLYNTSGFFKLSLDNVPIGNYRLWLNLPTPVSTDMSFNSSSTRVSAIYSFASRDTFQSVNSHVTIRVYARNIHNQTIYKNADSALLIN